MSTFTAARDGGKSNEEAWERLLRQVSSNDAGPLRSTHLSVGVHTPNNNTVDVATGDIAISYQNYLYHNWSDAVINVTITDNSSGNPRIDSIVAYVDLSVVSSSSNNNPGAFKIIAVAGTPAGSPVAPDGTAIQAAVGAGNPYYVSGNVNVPNGFTSSSTITNSGSTVIVDERVTFLIGSGGRYGFFFPDVLSVANDQAWNPPALAAQTLVKMYAYARTAPVGSNLTIQIYNVTQSRIVGSITITAGSNSASTTTFTNAAINEGDVLRGDVTAIGSTTPGSNVSVTIR